MTAIEEITADMDWRLGELGVLKFIPYHYHMNQNHMNMLRRYIVPAIYALWEGFVKKTMLVYIREINKANIMAEALSMNILLYTTKVDENLRLTTIRDKRPVQEKFIKNFRDFISLPVHIKPSVETESNVNLEVANKLLGAFNIEQLPGNKYSGKLHKLLNYRNAIAHGDNSISVSEKDVAEFSDLIVDLMADVVIRVEKGLDIKSYLEEAS